MSSHGGGGDRWLVSYSDFITLLMVLFVVLYSMGQTDLKRYKEMAKSFQAAFSVGNGGGAPAKVVDPSIDQSSGTSTESGRPAPIVIEGLPKASEMGVEVAGQLTEMLKKTNLSSEVSVQSSVEGTLISLSEKLLFKTGTAELNADGYPVLDNVFNMIKPMDNEIRIVGYTDNSAPVGYKDNWQLSFARAYLVLNYLEGKGITARRLVASGRGDSAPVFPNDSDAHKTLNNRVEIVVIYPQKVQDVINLNESINNPTGVQAP
jgi:chemotaxis protein MotB